MAKTFWSLIWVVTKFRLLQASSIPITKSLLEKKKKKKCKTWPTWVGLFGPAFISTGCRQKQVQWVVVQIQSVIYTRLHLYASERLLAHIVTPSNWVNIYITQTFASLTMYDILFFIIFFHFNRHTSSINFSFTR